MTSILAEQWIDAMRARTGVPYVFGGKSVVRDGGLDCSGLLTSTAPLHFLGDPDYTSANALKESGPRVSEATAQRGTIVLFHSTYGDRNPNYATHCGVWLKPGIMIDTHDGVHETDYRSAYWQAHLMGFWHPRALVEPEGSNMADAALVNLLGYLRGDVADAIQAGLDGAKAAVTDEEREAAYQSIQAATNTLRTA